MYLYIVASVRITRSDLDTEAVYEEPNCQTLPRRIMAIRGSDDTVSLEDCPAYGVPTFGDR